MIGSVEPALADRAAHAGLPLVRHALGWQLGAPGAWQPALDTVADWLIAHGHAKAHRHERLAVTPRAGGGPLATVERSVVRTLGIATVAVHLVGLAADEGDGVAAVWVQQRALDKATDPGRWDTLMGGQVAADETVEDALRRETMEEAGLDVAGFMQLEAAPAVSVRRPVPEGEMVERVDVFVGRLAPGVSPRNLDGEVAAFACRPLHDLVARLAAGDFTLEATLVHGAWLERHHPACLAA